MTLPSEKDHNRLQNLRISEISNRQIKIFGKDEFTGSNPVISLASTISPGRTKSRNRFAQRLRDFFV